MKTNQSKQSVPPVLEGKANTPNIKKSKKISLLVFFVISIFFLLFLRAVENKKLEKISLENEINSGQILTRKIIPGGVIKIMLTYEFISLWSSNEIKTYDDQGKMRSLIGRNFVSGSPFTRVPKFLVFKNTSKKTITIKIGRGICLKH